MNQWPDSGGQGQPGGQPFSYQDPAQPSGWPAGFQPSGSMQPAQQFPPAPAAPVASDAMIAGEPVLVTIGDISVTSTTVYTPSGSRPLSEVSWTFTDMSTTSQAIPTWAIVCAIVFFLACFIGLVFLLAKENSTTGVVQVSVHGNGFVHTTTIPVSSINQVADISARVSYARSLTGTGYQQPGPPGQLGVQDRQPGQPW